MCPSAQGGCGGREAGAEVPSISYVHSQGGGDEGGDGGQNRVRPHESEISSHHCKGV